MFVLHISRCHTTPPIAFKNSSSSSTQFNDDKYIVRLLVFSFLSLSFLLLLSMCWRACAMALVFFFILILLHCTRIMCVCAYCFTLMLFLWTVCRDHQLLEFQICVDPKQAERSILYNARIRVCNPHIVHMYLYTHKSTFHTYHLSFFLYACLPLLFYFLWHFVRNLCRMYDANGSQCCCCWTSWEREKEINFINIITRHKHPHIHANAHAQPLLSMDHIIYAIALQSKFKIQTRAEFKFKPRVPPMMQPLRLLLLLLSSSPSVITVRSEMIACICS